MTSAFLIVLVVGLVFLGIVAIGSGLGPPQPPSKEKP